MLREWAYAGFTFDLVAAIISCLAGGRSHVPPPAFALALVLAPYSETSRDQASRLARASDVSALLAGVDLVRRFVA
jgi:hypothetical protein